MSKSFRIKLLGRMTRLFVIGMVCVGIGQATAAAPDKNSTVSLRARYAELGKQLSNNQFKQPIYLESAESPDHLKGDIYALVNYPFAIVNKALNNPAHWCDVLILHVNTKYCHASTSKTGSTIQVSIGKKIYQPLEEAYRLEFAYDVATVTNEYFDVRLNAKTGPLGTSDYHIRLEAVSVKNGKTFLHLTYSYASDYVAQIAMQGYLATIGSDKVGFTKTTDKSGYIGGVRGVVERNTMRYYLAIDAYLGALSTPPSKQLEKRLQSWFTSTELYRRQLHEVDRAAYMDMKRREYARQQKPASLPPSI